MDQNNMNQGVAAGEGTTENKPVGPLIAIIIIVILVALGGFYLWKNKTTPAAAPTGNAENSVADIEADLGSVDTAATSELDTLEKQF